ncbi:MAG: tetratricopeptide repeat protein, partial [Clostridia bacterium]|nr:tetratricopeptide repeat protein [Clostridia bacterium]
RTEGGTALLNAATVYKAAGRAEESMSLFSRAEELYRRLLPPDDERMGGLYNNMALTLVDLGRFSEARTCYSEAIRVMSLQKNGKPETAITWLNLASLSESEFGLESDEAQEEISACLRNASDLLEQEKDRTDGGYAFVCEKCAPVFGRYGYFWMEEELNERARRIYQRA